MGWGGYSQVLFARSPTDFALFVEEVENTPQDGQQQDADDDDCNDDTFALWGEEEKEHKEEMVRFYWFRTRLRLGWSWVVLGSIPESADGIQHFAEENKKKKACASFQVTLVEKRARKRRGSNMHEEK